MEKKRIFGVLCCLKSEKKKIENKIKKDKSKHQTKTWVQTIAFNEIFYTKP